MSYVVGELVAPIMADTAPFASGLQNVQRMGQTVAQGISGNFQAMGKQIASLGGGGAAGQAALGQLRQATDGFTKSASGLLIPTSAAKSTIHDLATSSEKAAHAAEKAGQQVKNAGGHMHGAQQPATSFTGAITDMSTQMNLMMGGMAMSGVFTAPFVLAIKGAANASIGFEDAFAGVRKTVDASEPEFKQIAGNFRNLAQQIPVTAEEFARIGELAGQLGIRGVQNINRFSEVIAKLGVTTNLSTEEAATSLARLANITQMPISNMDRLGSTVVDLGNNLATTEREIVEFALRIAGAGSQVGLSEPKILAFGAALSSVGINAEAGGTALSRVFAKLAVTSAKGGEDLEAFARVAGMSVEQFRKAFQEDAAGATIAFVTGLKRIQDEGGNVFAVLERLEMDDIRVRDALLRTAGAGDLLARSIGIASKAWEENTALNVEAEKRFVTTASQIQITKNKFAETARELGDRFLPAINGVLAGLGDLATNLREMPPWLEKLLLGLGGVAAVVGPLMLGMAGLGAVITGVKSATGALALVLGASAGPAIMAVVAAVGALAAISVISSAQSAQAKQKAADQAGELKKLRDRYTEVTEALKDTSIEESESIRLRKELRDVTDRIGTLIPGFKASIDDEKEAFAQNTLQIERNIRVREQLAKGIKNFVAPDDNLTYEIMRLEEMRANLVRKINSAPEPSPYRQRATTELGAWERQLAQVDTRLEEVREKIRIMDLGNWVSPLTESASEFMSSVEMARKGAEAAKKTVTGSGTGGDDSGGKKVEFLEAFNKAWARSMERAKDAFAEQQEAALELVKDRHEAELADLAAQQAKAREMKEEDRKIELAAFDKTQKGNVEAQRRGLDSLMKDFTENQERETKEYRRGAEDRRRIAEKMLSVELDLFRKNEQDKLDARRKANEEALDALRQAQSLEIDQLDEKARAEAEAIQKQIDSIRAQEKAEAQTRRMVTLTDNVAKAEKELEKARMTRDPAKIADAQRDLNRALSDLDDERTQQARNAEVERLQAQIQAIRDSAERDRRALQEKQQRAYDAKRDELEREFAHYQELSAIAIRAKDEEIEARRIAQQREFEDEAEARAKLQELARQAEKERLDGILAKYQEQQAIDREAKLAELDADRKHFEAQQAEAVEKVKQRQGAEITELRKAQKEKATLFGEELEDLKDSFENKLAEQRRFIDDWNAGVNRLLPVVAQFKTEAPQAAGPAPTPPAPTPPAAPPASPIPVPASPFGPGNFGAAGNTPIGGLPPTPGPPPEVAVPIQPGIPPFDAFGLGNLLPPGITSLTDLIKASLPKFAAGAVATGETVGIFGEVNTEAVLPLTWLRRQMESWAQSIVPRAMAAGASMMSVPALALASAGAAGGSGPIVVQLQLSNRTMEEIYVAGKQQARRRGRD